jgi:hypothetical protein
MKNIEYYKDEFTRLFREMELIHGRCESVTIEHGNEMMDATGDVIAENIEVGIKF